MNNEYQNVLNFLEKKSTCVHKKEFVFYVFQHFEIGHFNVGHPVGGCYMASNPMQLILNWLLLNCQVMYLCIFDFASNSCEIHTATPLLFLFLFKPCYDNVQTLKNGEICRGWNKCLVQQHFLHLILNCRTFCKLILFAIVILKTKALQDKISCIFSGILIKKLITYQIKSVSLVAFYLKRTMILQQ